MKKVFQTLIPAHHIHTVTSYLNTPSNGMEWPGTQTVVVGRGRKQKTGEVLESITRKIHLNTTTKARRRRRTGQVLGCGGDFRKREHMGTAIYFECIHRAWNQTPTTIMLGTGRREALQHSARWSWKDTIQRQWNVQMLIPFIPGLALFAVDLVFMFWPSGLFRSVAFESWISSTPNFGY